MTTYLVQEAELIVKCGGSAGSSGGALTTASAATAATAAVVAAGNGRHTDLEEGLRLLGLPKGSSFQTKEASMVGNSKIRYWRWGDEQETRLK